MQANSNPVLESYQHQMDASREVAGVVFDVADKMEHLVLDATRKAFDERMRFYQSLTDVRAPQDVLAFQAEFFSHTPEHLLKVQQEWVRIFAESQEKISKTVQHYKVGFNGDGAIQPLSSESDGASHASGALTSIFSMWDKAFKQTIAMATGSMKSVLPSTQKDDEVLDVEQKPVKRRSTRAK
jgi:Phasin protein